LDEMLAVEKPDVLSLATPTNLHVQGLESALAAGVPVVVLEKPVSWAESDLADLLPSLVRTATKIVVAYQRRWSGNFIKLAEYLQRGGIGEVVKVHVNYPMGLIHGGTHALDLLHWYFGPCSEARSLTVLAEPVRDAVLDCQFEWPGGLRASFQGFAREPWNLFEMDFFGTKGRVRAGCGGRTMEFFAAAPDPDYPRLTALAPVDEPFASDWQGAYVNLGDHLVDLLERPEARPRCSLDDGLFALRAAAAALRSAVSGGARTPI
jgi:predicted dehydrogenase